MGFAVSRWRLQGTLEFVQVSHVEGKIASARCLPRFVPNINWSLEPHTFSFLFYSGQALRPCCWASLALQERFKSDLDLMIFGHQARDI